MFKQRYSSLPRWHCWHRPRRPRNPRALPRPDPEGRAGARTGRRGTASHAAGPGSEFPVPPGSRLDAAGRRAEGEIKGPYTLPSKAYPGTQHTYWIYVPAQYDPKVPASLMVYQDGQAFKDPNGDLRAQNVMDNLIYRHEIPVMLGVFINPGRTPEQPEPTPADWATAPPTAPPSTTRRR